MSEKKKERMSQRKAVLDWLSTGTGITSMDAFKAFGATRLSAIVFDLRRRGHDIEAVKESGKDRFGNPTTYVRYFLRGGGDAQPERKERTDS